MKKIIDPFIDFLPSIDLHGMDRDTALFKTKEFIDDNIKMKKYDLIIIHGKGTGILRRSVHEYLKHDKRVIEYKIDNFNDGETIVKIGEKNEK